jgi:hypothetical protein
MWQKLLVAGGASWTKKTPIRTERDLERVQADGGF